MCTENQIKLSQWFACLDTKKNFPVNNKYKFEDFGPLRVYNKDSKFHIHFFGHENKNIIIFEGFIFDDENLMPGHTPLSCNSSKLVSFYYEKFGEKIFNKLKGRYLLAVWDHKKNKFLLGRDGLGKYPLYYSESNNKVWFSSNLLALSSSGFVNNSPDRLSLSLIIIGAWPENESTSFEFIKKPRPGYYLKLDDSSLLKKIFYFTPVPDCYEPYIGKDESIEKFEEHILNSVNKCMQISPKGLMLSGGIDSVLVAALANKYTSEHLLSPLVACSARNSQLDNSGYEIPMQNKVSNHFKMPQEFFFLSDWLGNRELVDISLIETNNFSYPGTYYWAGGFMNFWREMSSRGLNSFLTGSGGDELFGLHGAYTADLIKNLDLRKLIDFILSEKRGGKSWKKIIDVFLIRHGIKLIMGSYWSKLYFTNKKSYNRNKILKAIPEWLGTDNYLKKEILEILYDRRTHELDSSNRIPKDYYRHSLRASFNNGYMNYEAERNYNNTHLAGISLMSPYHDIDATQFFLRVNPEMFMIGRNYKGLLRSLSSKYLPGFGLENQKKLYGPKNQDIASVSLEKISKLLMNSSLSNVIDCGIIKNDSFKQYISGNKNYSFSQNYRLFSIISVDKWLSKNT